MIEKITLSTIPKFRPLRVIYTVFWVFVCIGAGVAVDSTPMQWFGFLVLCLLVIALSSAEARRHQALTFDQARKRIDELEKEQE